MPRRPSGTTKPALLCYINGHGTIRVVLHIHDEFLQARLFAQVD